MAGGGALVRQVWLVGGADGGIAGSAILLVAVVPDVARRGRDERQEAPRDQEEVDARMGLSMTGRGLRWLSRLAVCLGVLLLVAAPVLRFWITPVLAQSALVPGPDSPLTHMSSGTISTLFDVEGGAAQAEPDPIPVTRTQTSTGDAAGAEQAAAAGANAAVTDSTDRTVTADGRLISELRFRLAADRRTQALVSCCGARVGAIPVTAVGAGSPLRLPWFVPDAVYPYFDLTLLVATQLDPIGTEEVSGIQAAKFQQVLAPTPIGPVAAPGELVGSDAATVTLVRTHSVNRTLWVDPTTGIILRKVERVREALRDANGDDVLTLLAMTTASTPEQVDALAAHARQEARPVLWAHSYGPALGIGLGVLLLGLGLLGVALRTRALRIDQDFPDVPATFEDLKEAFD
ncbi:MAG: porin PorA family protein [Candidatus Nanopelagicales bacterium]